MADNVNVTPGTTNTVIIGADSCTVNGVPSVLVSLGKLGFGGNDAFTYVSTSAGLPVAQQGTWSVGVSGSVGVTGTFWQATQPVSGTVAVSNTAFASTQSGTWLVGLSAGSNVVGGVTQSGTWNVGVTGSVAVTGTFFQATQPVSLAALPALAAGSAAIGTVGVTALPALPSGSNTIGAVTISSLPALSAGTNTIGNVNSYSAGDVIQLGGTAYTILKAFANVSAAGLNQVVAATSGKKVRVLKFNLSAASAVSFYFAGTTAGAVCATKYILGAGGPYGSGGLSVFGHFNDTASGDALQVNLSAPVLCGIDVLYINL